MKLEQWVLFIDMLGYRDINGEITNDEDAEGFVEFMKSNEKIFATQDEDDKKKMYEKQSFDLYSYYEIQLTFVSDSLIINYKPKEFQDENVDEKIRMLHSANALFIILNRLQTFIYNCFSQKEIFVRGGISNKYCYVENNFAVGQGIIDAYIQESKRAIYPRIVLSGDIVKKAGFMESFSLIANHIYSHDTFLNSDENGVVFLDYLKFNIAMIFSNMLGNMNAMLTVNSFLKIHKEVIEKKLTKIKFEIENTQNEKVIENLKKIEKKITWLKEYHNESVKEKVPQYLIH